MVVVVYAGSIHRPVAVGVHMTKKDNWVFNFHCPMIDDDLFEKGGVTGFGTPKLQLRLNLLNKL